MEVIQHSVWTPIVFGLAVMGLYWWGIVRPNKRSSQKDDDAE